MPITHILTDIEGTTSSISFVADVLFPYAADHLPGFLAAHGDDPVVRAHLDHVRRAAGLVEPGEAPLIATLLAWMAADRKDSGLKSLQGLIWESGFRNGDVTAHVYPEVPEMLARWRDDGIRLAVFSSGSVHAQRLFFAHTTAGDLSGLFSAHVDTTTGPKRDPASYAAICARLGVSDPREVLYLSDVVAELDAAAEAGLNTHLICRADPIVGSGHPMSCDFAAVAEHWCIAAAERRSAGAA